MIKEGEKTRSSINYTFLGEMMPCWIEFVD